ncbi:DNA replication/repair protein RecF [Aureibacter tunicatorum]|uniref:DNA replication and repair protein RecF n=1 Tax=Aureibacter tunicatorum TaxID=866807 RepID=A0AAE3XJY1_9BACT|nr:DNA replication and repair protein RecF [Aureibacter tunicatorum]MDR6237315.1 DNA replication and repair protein RecF [Aureibacter tunicatorum]BDD06306.1 DNA replication and repair protein RecF [Aureibacter tunicatorum]
MFLKNISLFNFKNYENTTFEFSREINCIIGDNGLGKTNLLDAIHYLSLGKSMINTQDTFNIRHDELAFAVKGIFQKNDRSYKVSCGFQKSSKKTLMVNGEVCGRLSSHVGQFPVVVVGPQDQDLVWGGSEFRRKLFDSMLSQVDNVYLESLIRYSHYLTQRNAYLKGLSEGKPWDELLMDHFNHELSAQGRVIFEKREKFLDSFNEIFRKYYKMFTRKDERVEIKYKSGLRDHDFMQKLKENIEKDRILQRTTFGVHRDDYSFVLDDFPLKKYASQGQQKSFTIAVKLAKFEFMMNQCGYAPLLLFDDLFDKLDENRTEALLDLISKSPFEQVMITEAKYDRLQALLEKMGIAANMLKVDEN